MKEKKAEQMEKKRRSKKENPMGTSFDALSSKKKGVKNPPIKSKKKESAKTNQPKKSAKQKQTTNRGKENAKNKELPIKSKKKAVKILFLGGVGEIGKNMTAIEYGKDIIIIDAGLTFPNNEDMPGVDCVVPDITYLVQNKDKIRGVVLTHGH